MCQNHKNNNIQKINPNILDAFLGIHIAFYYIIQTPYKNSWINKMGPKVEARFKAGVLL